MKRTALLFIAVVFVPVFFGGDASCQAKTVKSFPLWNFDEREGTCRAKGRLQDIGYCSSKTMDQILAEGKDAIPILISQLTDTRPTKQPIFDFWPMMRVGDVAAFILNDLFLDADWKTFNLPGLEALNHDCADAGWVCWDRFVEKHGRKFIQSQWQTAWDKNRSQIDWDEKARCFRVMKAGKSPAKGRPLRGEIQILESCRPHCPLLGLV